MKEENKKPYYREMPETPEILRVWSFVVGQEQNMKKTKTEAEKTHLNRVAQLGCIVCNNLMMGRTPAEIHHLRDGQGVSQRSNHFRVIPLCPTHHRTGGYGVAFHAGEKAFEEKYGTELELLEQVNSLLELLD